MIGSHVEPTKRLRLRDIIPALPSFRLPRVDGRARIEFYARRGLIARVPTTGELEWAAGQNAGAGAGPAQRLRYYLRHPLDVLPTATKKRKLRQSNATYGDATVARTPTLVPLPRLDRLLRTLMLLSPIRFVANALLNPFYLTKDSGLNVPTRYVIEHVLHSPHPSALWDLQIIHADPGGLDEFERKLELYSTSRCFRARLYRAMAQRDGYYAYLRTLAAQVRRFEYPAPRRNVAPEFENLVDYLRFAIAEQPRQAA